MARVSSTFCWGLTIAEGPSISVPGGTEIRLVPSSVPYKTRRTFAGIPPIYLGVTLSYPVTHASIRCDDRSVRPFRIGPTTPVVGCTKYPYCNFQCGTSSRPLWRGLDSPTNDEPDLAPHVVGECGERQQVFADVTEVFGHGGVGLRCTPVAGRFGPDRVGPSTLTPVDRASAGTNVNGPTSTRRR